MFEYQGKIRYSETDANLQLTIPALLNYFQDAAIFEGENISVCMEELEKMHLTWVLNSWQVMWSRMPKINEDIIIGTVPYDFKGFTGSRNFYLKNAKTGEQLACGTSVWVLIDLQKMIPIRPPRELAGRYPLGKQMDIPYEGRRIFTQGKGEIKESVLVRKSQIDSNHHVNNTEYVTIAMDYIPVGRTVNQIRAEYKKSAVLNDEMIPEVFVEDERIVVSLKNTDDDIFALIEFKNVP